MSEKPIHGGKPTQKLPPVSEKPLSEKLVSEKSEHQNFGQPNIKNRIISNSSLENEQEYDHRSGTNFTPEIVKEIIGFDQLQLDVQSWGEMLRDTLHGFSSSADERKYQRTMDRILQEIVSQLVVKLNRTTEAQELLELVQGPTFAEMMNGLLAHWREIRNVRGYIAASLENL